MNPSRIRFMIVFMIAAILLSSCSFQTPASIPTEAPETLTPTPEPTPEGYPFEGIWFRQDRGSMLIITSEMVYLHEFEAKREVYARIEAVDLDAETILVFNEGILMSGQAVGFDYPQIEIRYHLNGTVLEFSGKHLDFVPDDEEPSIFILDESLN